MAGASGRVHPVLAFPPEFRRVISTTNLIDPMNARLCKATRDRGPFPAELAVLKVLYLAAFRRLSSGFRSSGWKQALQAVTSYFGGRIPAP